MLDSPLENYADVIQIGADLASLFKLLQVNGLQGICLLCSVSLCRRTICRSLCRLFQVLGKEILDRVGQGENSLQLAVDIVSIDLLPQCLH